MAADFPYTHYACPCSDITSTALPPTFKRSSILPTAHEEDAGEDRTFNPHDPRANYTLYPLDHLLFCDECDAIRCPRCWTEEVMNWYCPACLFEVPSSAVKNDGNRCSRNCYSCPICQALMVITTLSSQSEEHLKPSDAGAESYILQCQYCDWTTLDIGVQFNKPTKITEQLAKLRKARTSPNQDRQPSDKSEKIDGPPLSHDEAFANLSNFYKDQPSEMGDPQNPYSSTPYSSPANLARIMSLYGGLSYNALKKSREKPQPMREAGSTLEGLSTYSAYGEDGEARVLHEMESLGWEGTATAEQRLAAPVNNDARFVNKLWPVATPLRTRRGKRCRTCRQFLARPDTKVGSLRYKIRLLALNHLPRLSIRPLQAPYPPPPTPAFRLRADDPTQPPLRPHAAQQYILTVRNPIFETIKVTLATPTMTPGKVRSRVTILCPSFIVDPAGDVWDEALSSSTQATNDGSRKAAMASLTGSAEASTERQPEAGKIWDKTRNSTSVILEIVPGALKPPPSIVPKTQKELADEELGPDGEMLDVPVYVRAEWEAELNQDEVIQKDKERGERVKKEIAFWCVLGVGRIAE